MRGVVAFEDALARPEPAAPEGDPLEQRLRGCSRLVTLVADEMAALDRGDVVAGRQLAEARESLLRETFPVPEGSEGDEDGVRFPLDVRIAELLAEALEALHLRELEERRMQDCWSSLEEDALKAIHVGGRIVSLRAGRYQNGPSHDASLDLRF
jgi:hypothetical protein